MVDEPEESEEDSEEEVAKREQQVLGLEQGLGMWLVAARRTALSASGKQNDDEIEIRAAGGTTTAESMQAVRDADVSTDAAGVKPINRSASWSAASGGGAGAGAEWDGGGGADFVAIGKHATDKHAPDEDVSGGSSGKVKGGRNRGGKQNKRGKQNKGKNDITGSVFGDAENSSEGKKSDQLKFDSKGRPIIKVSATGGGGVPSLAAVKDAALAVLEQQTQTTGGTAKAKGKAGGGGLKKKAKGGGGKKHDTPPSAEEELVVRVGFEYECSCGCRTLADGGVDVAATAAARQRAGSPVMGESVPVKKKGRRKGKQQQEEDEEDEAVDQHAVSAQELEEKRRPLGLVDSMPLLAKCGGGSGGGQNIRHAQAAGRSCKKLAQLRRVFFTTPAVFAPLLPDGSINQQARAGLDLAPPKTSSGDAIDHATVTSWRCKLRLKVGSLAAAYVIVDGVTVPAKEFLDTDIAATALSAGPPDGSSLLRNRSNASVSLRLAITQRV